MKQPMSDSDFSVPDRRAPTRQPKRAERVWTLKKGASIMRAELRSHGSVGVEFQIFEDDRVIYGRWYSSRDLTLEEAEERRRLFQSDGWMAAE